MWGTFGRTNPGPIIARGQHRTTQICYFWQFHIFWQFQIKSDSVSAATNFYFTVTIDQFFFELGLFAAALGVGAPPLCGLGDVDDDVVVVVAGLLVWFLACWVHTCQRFHLFAIFLESTNRAGCCACLWSGDGGSSLGYLAILWFYCCQAQIMYTPKATHVWVPCSTCCLLWMVNEEVVVLSVVLLRLLSPFLYARAPPRG